MKGFLKNPVGLLILMIVALVIAASYLDAIMRVAALIVLGLLVFSAGKVALGRWGNPSNHAVYCGQCSHLYHGRQPCGICRCRRS